MGRLGRQDKALRSLLEGQGLGPAARNRAISAVAATG